MEPSLKFNPSTRQTQRCRYNPLWGFPKIRGTFLGVPIIRIIVFGGLYILGSPSFGKLPYSCATTLNLQGSVRKPELEGAPYALPVALPSRCPAETLNPKPGFWGALDRESYWDFGLGWRITGSELKGLKGLGLRTCVCMGREFGA